MGVFGKRGVSAVIASVLMILLVLALSSIVFSWARGFVDDKGEAVQMEYSSGELCRAINFDIVVVNKTGNDYEFEAVNRGNVNLSALRFRIFPGGDSNIVDSAVILLAGGSVVGHVVLSGVIDRVEALGVLDGGESQIVCGKNPVHLENFEN